MPDASANAEVGLCLLLAAADGEISDAELGALTTRLGRLLGDDFPLGELEGLLEGEMSAISDLGVDEYVVRLPARIAPDRRVEALRSACEVACADGLSPEEDDLLRAAARALEVDADAIVGAIGYRKTDYAEGADHADEPDDRTHLLGERLAARGWTDPMRELREAGIDVGQIGALALQYRSVSGPILRIEHHTCDGSVHLHVTDDDDVTVDYVVFPEGREADLVDALVAMQDELSPANVVERLPKLRDVGRVCRHEDGELVDA
jgi:uncharacterized tellurite resistance protein B-like protein